ncbi:MAG: hypothetical protein ABH869_04105 [Candidatus Omnitrophota bacterium]
MLWLEFLSCAGLLTYFAYYLCVEGVIISERTHIEEGIIGMFFLAIATSFPEIVTSSTAVFSFGKIGLGYGNILGSIMVNFMILLGVDYFMGKGRLLARVSRINLVTAVFILSSIAVILAAVFFRKVSISLPALNRIGVESVVIIIIYLLYLRTMRQRGARSHEEHIFEEQGSFFKIWFKFIFFLIVVMALSMWMAGIGAKLTVNTGLSETFIGTLFLGLTTSFPEIIVSFAALRAGSLDMAVGNILGSNIFDISVVSFLDLLSGTPILSMLTSGQIMATIAAMILAVITVIALIVRGDSSRRINWDTLLIFTAGFIGFVILYFIR